MNALPENDFEIPCDPELFVTEMSIDEATDLVFNSLDWPLLGGPSGRGWSSFSTAQRCARLFQATYDQGDRREALRQMSGGKVSVPLQVGGLYHTFQALYTASQMGDTVVVPDRGGLIAEGVPLRGRRVHAKFDHNCVEVLYTKLRAMAEANTDQPKPAINVILEAKRLFEAHVSWWDNQIEKPLAVEYFAAHKELGYTCRYDAIVHLEESDTVPATGTYIVERKTAKFIDESYIEGWTMDGEVLGELLCWQAGGCEEVFGPLKGLIIDVVSKAKNPSCHRLFLPPHTPHVDRHAKWIRWTQAQISAWRAMGFYPQSFGNCHSRWGRCENWSTCTTQGVE